ncbi:MAG TPA: hypothetical protein DCE41_22640 [Cytophagales bacterium]|nr:hypothetical protein [Cytophagales bacterium]
MRGVFCFILVNRGLSHPGQEKGSTSASHLESQYIYPMHERVMASLRKTGRFPDDVLAPFFDILKAKEYAKGENLLVPGEKCQMWFFIDQGSVRQFTEEEDGTERTVHLFLEDDWVFDAQSFTAQKPARGYLQALETTRGWQFSIHDIHDLIKTNPVFFQLGTLLELGVKQAEYHRSQNTPEAKYRALMAEKPQWVHRFPLKYIASYLGITPETLSRVRRKLMD